MNLNEHPCFNPQASRHFGRVHLPVAPRCNMQCKFCNRLFDCVNESRPGVTSAILSPAQAMVYLQEVLRHKPGIRVVGIAGPGDPFANAAQTLETCRRVRERFPDMMLCIATNGLNLSPYLDELAEVNVSHVTLTVNAVDPAIGARIYAWMRIGKRVVPAAEGAAILLTRQLDAIRGLKARGITVKINSIIIPGINEDHIEAVACKMNELDVDLFNCMPYYPSKGSAFEDMQAPAAETVEAIRQAAGRHVRQMRHCTRCRSDAVGLLGEAPSATWMSALQSCGRLEVIEPQDQKISRRPHVAVASQEGVLVNQHLGEAAHLLIYAAKAGRPRTAGSPPDAGPRQWASALEGVGRIAERLPRRSGQRCGQSSQNNTRRQRHAGD